MLANCDKHGEFEDYGEELAGHRVAIQCPKCQEDSEAEEAKKAEEAKILERARFLKSANIEPEFKMATLESYTAETDEQKMNLQKVHDLVNGKIRKLIMTGKNGNGKTHLAIGAIFKLGGRILTMYEISTLIRSSYTPLAKQTELEIVDELARLPLLVIDEIGRTKGGDVEANWLSYIVDKRHSRHLPLILITNKHVKKDCTSQNGCADCLENYIGEDIMSRLTENGILARFTGKDHRKGKRED